MFVANPGMIAVAMGDNRKVNRLPGVYVKIPLLAEQAGFSKTDQFRHAIDLSAGRLISFASTSLAFAVALLYNLQYT